jgi:CheY-like chemotaxis protein
MRKMTTQSILIIDDCDNFRLVATNILLDAGYVVQEARCPHDAFELIRKEKFDMIFCDLHMPFTYGEEQADFQISYQVGIMTINELQGLFPDIPVVALTSTHKDDLSRIKSALKGISTFSKPTTKRELFQIVNDLQERAQQHAGMQ